VHRLPAAFVGALLAAAAGCAARDGATAPAGNDPCQSSVAVALGQSVPATLATTDCRLDDGSYADFYRLVLPADTVVRLDLTSTAFDAYLVLLNAQRRLVTTNDDFGGTSDAQIVRPLAAGTYFIVANSFDAGRTGPYTLQVQGTTTVDCPLTGTIAVGDSVAGLLGIADCQLPDGEYADAYQLTLATATPVAIRLASSDFDAFLVVRDSVAPVLADDDGGGGTDSQIVATLPAGRYTILATSFGPAVTGAYALTVRRR
jgi:hypothetical protein